jgi:hypothetical protein
MSTEREEWVAAVDRLDRCEQAMADLRAKVKTLRPASVPTGPDELIEAKADGWDEAIDAMLDLIDEGSDE